MEINYKAKIQLQIALEKLNLTPEQLKIFEEDIKPLIMEEYIIDEDEKCDKCSDYDNGYIDGHSEGYDEGYEDCEENSKLEERTADE